MGSTDYADLAVTVLFGVITLLALASLVLPFALRTSRLMWVVIVCGGALALVSSRVAITVDADGVVAGSAQPGRVAFPGLAGAAPWCFHPICETLAVGAVP